MQGNKKTTSKCAKLVLNQDEIEKIDNIKCARTLGVRMCPELKWNEQFEIMKDKMRETIGKLKNTVIFVLIAHFFNVRLTKKVHFGYGVFVTTIKQEETLMKMCEPVTLRKMGFSMNFPRKIAHAQK